MMALILAIKRRTKYHAQSIIFLGYFLNSQNNYALHTRNDNLKRRGLQEKRLLLDMDSVTDGIADDDGVEGGISECRSAASLSYIPKLKL